MKNRFALDWIDAILALAGLFAFIALMFALGARDVEMSRAGATGLALALPLLRRRIFKTPVRYTARAASASGTLTSLLIVAGILVASVGVFRAYLEVAEPPSPPVEQDALSDAADQALRAMQTPAERAASEQEARAMEQKWETDRAQARRHERVLTFEIAGIGLALIAVGGLLDRARMSRDAALQSA